MAYTVMKLAKLSGVSVRTLHWYDEVGLLKPAYFGANGYRYYEKPQLLTLQQILFYRELGLELKQIQKILGRADFNQVAALLSHRQALQENLARIRKQIRTIDKTVEHIKGNKQMKDKEIFVGLVLKRGKGTESYYQAETIIGENVKPCEDKESLTQEAILIFKQLAKFIDVGLKPTSPTVQEVIAKHHALTKKVSTGTKEVYQAYAQLYLEHPEFRKQFDALHPKLAPFFSEAMLHFADSEL